MTLAPSRKRFRALMAVGLGAGLALSLTGAPVPAQANTDIFESDPHLPAGLVNLARDKVPTASSTYEEWGWGLAFVNDGRISTDGGAWGWSTHATDATATETTPAWVQFDLKVTSSIERVALWPRSDAQTGANFPVDYTIQVSVDGQQWTTAASSTGNTAQTTAQVLDFEPAEGRFVRLHATRRAPSPGVHLVQLAELAVYGTPQGELLEVDKPALELLAGESDSLTPRINGVPMDPTQLEWTSDDPAVASVGTDGTVTAVALGAATITGALAGSAPLTVPVEVIAERTATDAEFMISAFWPPTAAHTTPEQYDYLADAHIDYIQNVDSTDLQGRAMNLTMAALAAERGMKLGVADPRLNHNLDLSDEEIREIVASWKNIPGVGGFYLKDEPMNANPYARVHRAVKAEAPWLYPYVNFFNQFVYPNRTTYESQMDDFLELALPEQVDYLIYDLYPFEEQPDTLNYWAMLDNMEGVRTVGLENDVKTGIYLQSIGRAHPDGRPNGYRRTNGAEIRYEVNAALAHGFKQLSYFTWFTPSGRPELFSDAIIAPDGTKTDLYEPVQQLNSEVKALGPTLLGLDSLEVYVNGPDLFDRTGVPADFLAQFGDDNVLVSRMVERDSGRQYLMVVNNDFTAAQSVQAQLGHGITQVEVISRVDGTSELLQAANGEFSFELAMGDAVLLRLPADLEYSPDEVVPVNLALDANVNAASSEGSNGWYLDKLTDGVRFSEVGTQGWRATDIDAQSPTTVTLDLRADRDFNRVDVYPTGDMFGYAQGFPGHVRLSVSGDGDSWSLVANQTLTAAADGPAPSLTFGAVTARYLRFEFSDYSTIADEPALQLSEVEVYHDDGSLPPPAGIADNHEERPWEEGMNLALQRPVRTSSSYEAGIWGWSEQFAVDGQFGPAATNNGWTSEIGKNLTDDAQEWLAVHLGGPYLLEEVVLHPRNSAGDRGSAGLGFPSDYQVQTSLDGITWTTVAEVTDDVEISETPRVFAFAEPVEASYLRVLGTQLKLGGNAVDGYLMQLGEVQAYGRPVGHTGPEPTPEPTATPEPTPTPGPTPAPTNPYVQPGLFQMNGRWWVTVCEPYSQTVRCRTDIWATTVSEVNGKFVQHQAWVFNNFTYLPEMTRAQWASNPLGHTTSWTAPDNRLWRTECDTEATGRGGCRTYTRSTVIDAAPKAGGGYTYAWNQKWVFNNMVLFRDR